MTKHMRKENNKQAASFKTWANVLRPIREWLHTMKSSTPISGPILVSNNGRIESRTNLDSSRQNHNSSNNSYGESLTGLSSNDMLSTAAPTPIHRYTPIGTSQGLMTMDDLNNSTSGFSGALEGGQFCRNTQARMSLPIMQQNKLRRQAYSQLQRRGQQMARSLGHIYLQHKGETKQANLPNELTTIDTLRALFVCAFPHLLSMEYMSQPHVKLYIYNPSCNIFYELCDIVDVKHESVLRIHHSDPMLPLALPPSIPVAAAMAQHYSTIHRMQARLSAQPPMQQQQQQQQQQQHQQQQRLQQQQQHLQQAQHVNTLPSHLIPQLQQQIAPPKPRRMIPANYSMHSLNPQ